MKTKSKNPINTINQLVRIFSVIIMMFVLIFASNVKAQNPFNIVSDVLDNSAFVTSNVPTTLKAGQTYSVSVTFKNTGLRTWGTDEPYALGLYDVYDNKYQTDVWGVKTVSLPHNVRSNDNVTFNFEIKAPYQPGMYNLPWSMMKNNSFFGQQTPMIMVTVTGDEINPGIINNNAAYISQSVPTNMTPDTRYKIFLTMKNTGSTTWYPYSYGNSYGDYKIAAVNDNIGTVGMGWGTSPVSLTQPVEPGNTATFEIEVISPPTPGVYNFQWQMMQGSSYFGEKSNPVSITVSRYGETVGTGYNTYGASFNSQSVPTTMGTNRTYSVSVTMNNTGNYTWTRGSYYLVYYTDPRLMRVIVNPWAIDNIDLPYEVSPGQSATFNFNVTAPSEAGIYDFQWIMNNAGTNFGYPSSHVSVSVVRRN